MVMTPENSNLYKQTPERIEQLNACTNVAQMIELQHQWMTEDGTATYNAADDLLEGVAMPSATAKKHVRIVIVGGEKHYIEGATVEEAKANADAFIQAHQTQQQTQPTQQQQTQPRNERGQFTSQEDVERIQRQEAENFERAQAQLQFQSGSITAEEYLERTGAVTKYLEKRGISQEVLEQIGGDAYTQKWADAVERFRTNHPEWPGGEENMQLMTQMIRDSGYADRDDVSPDEVLEGAYVAGIQNSVFVESATQEHERLLAEATTQEEISEANRRYAERIGMPTNIGQPDWR
jgi:hypothetical protein